SFTPTEAGVADRVGEEGLPNPEIAARPVLPQRTVATRLACWRKPGARSRMDITREPALRAAASRCLELRRPARRCRARHLGPGAGAGPGARRKVPRHTGPESGAYSSRVLSSPLLPAKARVKYTALPVGVR